MCLNLIVKKTKQQQQRNKSSLKKSKWIRGPKYECDPNLSWVLYMHSVSPLSGTEDGAGVTVPLPLLVSFTLTAGGRAPLCGLFAFEKVATRPEDLFFDLLVAFHIGEHLVKLSCPLHRRTSGGAWKKQRKRQSHVRNHRLAWIRL